MAKMYIRQSKRRLLYVFSRSPLRACRQRAMIALPLCGMAHILGWAGGAQAQPASLVQPQAAPAIDSLTYKGVTLYGAIDIDGTYETHGARNSSVSPPGAQYLLSKNSNQSHFAAGPNGITNSYIGLRALEKLDPDWSVSFRLETGYNPLTARLSDGVQSVISQNGKALAAQSTSADSSRAGQIFNQAAYVGVANRSWGSLLFGRQLTTLAEGVAFYDPELQSYAFSLIGYSGVAGGAGSTEALRLDDMFKYSNTIGPIKIGAMYGLPSGLGQATAYAGNIGYQSKAFSLDGYYTHKNDAVTVAPLSAAQLLGSAASATAAAAPPLPADSLAGVVSDNTAYAIMASYKFQKVRFYAAYETISFSNPDTPVKAGSSDIGGYELSAVNNTAYTHHKVLQIAWAGARYNLTPKLELGAGIYHYAQNSYGNIACSNTSAESCSGELYSVSASAIYHLTSMLVTYGGLMHTQVQGGLGSGYIHTNSMDPTVGMRFTF